MSDTNSSMAATQLSLVHAPAYRNQYLFSDHFLDYLLPQDARWEAGRADTQAFLTWAADLYAQEQAQLAAYSEAQLEEHWFKPLLTQLGHVYEPQAAVPGLGAASIKKPDYIFFPTNADRQAAVGAQKTEDYTARALAVGEVKAWDTHLSKKAPGGGVTFDQQNPSYQIDYYLKATALPWGILTNGRLWRLAHRESSYRLEVYYEVDLVDLLERGDVDALRYFVLFFRQAAFCPDAQGHIFLDDVLAGSNAYAVALEEDLHENAYLALEHLMQGFLDLTPNALTGDDVRAIYDNSLYLLYRLLFILYGESRGALPIANSRYRERYSLQRLKEEIAALLDKGEFIARHSTVYWSRLDNLFHLINGATPEFNAEVNVVRYNGGLFDPTLHPFLVEKQVGDQALVTAIDLLSRRETANGKEFVDYRTLGVRHLGSIYEGLLEYQPRLAAERVATIRNGKGERWVPVSQAPKDANFGESREAGRIYLETDKGERKATGSYYTPQYIVQYIVEQTLGPLVEEAGSWRQEAGGKRQKASNEEQDFQNRKSKIENPADFVERILAFKVLDPAMGSGHFLVEAADYLARALATDPYIAADVHAESDLAYWRRRVVERCIYGVDKNPLAVELAKLSLWLATFAEDKPLSFLDHHLKCGDSLVGAQVADVGNMPEIIRAAQRKHNHVAEGQLNLFAYFLSQQLPVMLSRVLEIIERESDSYETVRAKEAADHAIQTLKAPFSAVADLWTSAYFGLTYTQAEYMEALNLLHTPEKLLALPAVQQARAIADARGFFHWELAFPEVFFDGFGQPLGEERAGFDVVIGNPPYILLQNLSDGEDFFEYSRKTYIASRYKLDTYMLFMEAGIGLLSARGHFGYITPNTFLKNKFSDRLRALLLLAFQQINIVTIPLQVFPEASVDTCITIGYSGMEGSREVQLFQIESDLAELLAVKVVASKTFSDIKADPTLAFEFITGEVAQVLAHIGAISESFGSIGDAYFGIQTFDRKRFVTDKKLTEWHQPTVDGNHIDRYKCAPSTEWVDTRPTAIKSGGDQTVHSQDKIIVRQIGTYPVAYLDLERLFPLNTTYNLTLKEPNRDHLFYILALLNSVVLRKYWLEKFSDYKVTFPKIKKDALLALPIRRVAFTTPAAERTARLAEAETCYAASDTPALLAFTQACLDAQPEQADVVHDLLAVLAERMLALNRDKNARVAKFWTDLEGVTDAATFAKIRKGKQGRSLWAEPACRPFTTAESFTTHSLEESLSWSEDAFKAFLRSLGGKIAGLSHLLDVYRLYAQDYTACTAALARTDQTIDRLIYQLYRLTPEEIALVEGTPTQ